MFVNAHTHKNTLLIVGEESPSHTIFLLHNVAIQSQYIQSVVGCKGTVQIFTII